MATFKEIMKQLQKRQYNPVYLLYGEEPFYIDKIADFIEENVMEEADRDFNQVMYYAKDTQVADVIGSAREYPFGVPNKVVILKEAQEWTNLKELAPYIENPTDSTILVVCCKYTKEPKGVNLKKLPNVITFSSEKIPDYKLADWVTTCAADHEFTIEAHSASLIAEHIGNDLSRIDNEFKKLSLLIAPGSAVTQDIIEKYIGISKQYNVYELRDALVNRDEAKAYKIITVFSQNLKTNPLTPVIANLFYYYNSLLLFLLSPDKSTTAQKEIFGFNKSERQLAREAGIANRYSPSSLIKIIATLRELDARDKGIDNETSKEDLYKELVYRVLH